MIIALAVAIALAALAAVAAAAALAAGIIRDRAGEAEWAAADRDWAARRGSVVRALRADARRHPGLPPPR